MPAPIKDGNRVADSELVDLKLGESSGVDRGDNPEAHVMLLKQKAAEEAAAAAGKPEGFWTRVKRWVGVSKDMGSMQGPRTVDEIMMAQEFQEEFCELRYAFIESVYSILDGSPAGEMADKILATVNQFAARAKALCADMSAGPGTENAKRLSVLLESLQVAARDTGDVGKRAPFAAVLKDLEEFGFVPERVSAEKQQPVSEEDLMNPRAKLMESLKTAPEAVRNAALQAFDDAQKAATDSAAAQAASSDTAKALKELSEKLAASEKRAEETNKALLEEVGKLRDQAADAEFINKVRSMDLPVDTAKVAKVLRAAHAVSKENGAALEEVLTACSEQSQFVKFVQKQVGVAADNKGARTPGPGAGQASATDAMEKRAQEIQQASQKNGTPLTAQQAFKRAMDENPALANAAVNGDDGLIETDENG